VTRIGLSGGFIPRDPELLDETVASRISELGFTGVTLHLGDRPADLSPDRCEAICSWASRHGFRIVQSWAFGANLCHPDNSTRRHEIAIFTEAIRIAAALAADGVISGAGSVDPRGGYIPHRDNHSTSTEGRLIESLALLAPTAEAAGVTIALESHCRTVLDSPERTKRVIESVGSTSIRANLDPVNFVDSLAALYGSTELIDRVFDALGDVAAGGHVKDVAPGAGLVVQLDEVPLGQGLFDVQRFVDRFLTELPDLFLSIEHLPVDAIAPAKALLDSTIAAVQGNRG
jgi:sugar phosphate isomerase/epimerase